MCISSNSNTVFPCNICNTNTKDTDSAAQCDICQFWIHMKCNNVNHNDYKYLQGSSDPWFCISCCNEIFPFRILTNKNFLYVLSNCNPTTTKNSDASHVSNSSALALKPSSNLSLIFNQLITFLLSIKMSLEMLWTLIIMTLTKFRLQNLLKKVSHYTYFT